MSIKPILFNTEMVRAILDGRKTVTRRLVKPQPMIESTIYPNIDVAGKVCAEIWGNGAVKYIKQPYRRGDILWVRETWANHGSGYYYRADADERGGGAYYLEHRAGMTYESGIRWRPSIHMPREAARIWLRVTNVRVERLNDIDEAGAIAEGLYEGYRYHGVGSCALSARQAFSWFWQFITLDAPAWQHWALNPWVWVIGFERCEKPEEDA